MKKVLGMWWLILLILVGCVSYGQTLRMYFWQDDSALIFKLQNPAGQAGSFGEGVIGNGPYKYLVTLFVPFFPIFGLEPLGYFAVGLMGFFLSVGIFYKWMRDLFEDRKGARLATIVFASGYVGSDIMFRIINSWQSTLGISLAILVLWMLTRYKKKGRVRNYVLAILFFLACVEFVFVRSHSLIFAVFALDLFLTLGWGKGGRKWLELALRQAPFWLVFYWRYLKEAGLGGEGLVRWLTRFFGGGIEVAASLVATVGNVFFPEELQLKLLQVLGSGASWAVFLGLAIFGTAWLKVMEGRRRLYPVFWVAMGAGMVLNKYFVDKDMFWYRTGEAAMLLVGWFIVASQVMGYHLQYPEAIWGTVHRYLHYAALGYALMWGAAGMGVWMVLEKKGWLGGKKWGWWPVGLVVVVNLVLGWNYQQKIVTERSEPTRTFYKNLRRFVPQISPGAVFYFDVADENLARQQFRDFFSVGSMPESTAIAIYYGLDRDEVKVLTDFNELLWEMDQGRVKMEGLNSFYYDRSGLVDTSFDLRQMLSKGMEGEMLENEGKVYEAKKVRPLVPLLVEITGRVVPDKDRMELKQEKGDVSYLALVWDYLAGRREYYKRVKAESLSEWRYQEVEKAVDGDTGTSWRGHRIYWHENRHERLQVDLGEIKLIDRVVWLNWNHTLAPVSYTIEVADGRGDFRVVKRVEKGPERKDGEMVEERLDSPVQARYVKMEITGTVSEDAPALSEFEVVESRFSGVDLAFARKIESRPFAEVDTGEEFDLVLERSVSFLKLEVEAVGNGGGVQGSVPVEEFNKLKKWEVILPPKGSVPFRLSIGVPEAPVSLGIDKVVIRPLTFEELKNRGLVREFSLN